MLRHSIVMTGMRRCACSEHTACASSPEEWLFELRTKAKEWRKVNGMGKSCPESGRTSGRHGVVQDCPLSQSATIFMSSAVPTCRRSQLNLLTVGSRDPHQTVQLIPQPAVFTSALTACGFKGEVRGKRLHLCSEWGNHYSYWVKIFQCSLLRGEAPTLL